jgi:hypothetical protein
MKAILIATALAGNQALPVDAFNEEFRNGRMKADAQWLRTLVFG